MDVDIYKQIVKANFIFSFLKTGHEENGLILMSLSGHASKSAEKGNEMLKLKR